MKRSERLYLHARQHALWSVFFLLASVACGVWAVRAGLSDHWAVIPLVIAALAALYTSFAHGGETSRLLDLARREEAYEWEHSYRPRI